MTLKMFKGSLITASFAVTTMGCSGFHQSPTESQIDIQNDSLQSDLLQEKGLLTNSVGGFLYANETVELATRNVCSGRTIPAFAPSLALSSAAELVIDDGTRVLHQELLDKSDLLKRRTLKFPNEVLTQDSGRIHLTLRSTTSVNDGYPSLLQSASTQTLNYSRNLEGKIEFAEDVSLSIRAANPGETADCPRPSDPLVILFSGKSSVIEMTSPKQGVLFNISGINAETQFASTPHAKKQISWMKPCAECFFLALPNSQGAITGIDELFGDNTQGPDGKTANDGFEALSKHDTNHDKVIDEKDPIFSALRLWNDKNMDGLATGSEIYTLSDKDLQMISLRYDKSFREVDSHGNEIRFKSLVKTKSSVGYVFDLWLQLDQ